MTVVETVQQRLNDASAMRDLFNRLIAQGSGSNEFKTMVFSEFKLWQRRANDAKDDLAGLRRSRSKVHQ